MRRRLHMLKQYLRFKKHIAYVEHRTLQLRAKICNDACITGTVDNITRHLYLKYNNRLIELHKRYKTL